MIDIHSHTTYSCDGRQQPEEALRAAIKAGCKIFGFSEHLDYDYIANNLEVNMTDVNAYYENALRLKYEYKNKITLLCGIEFGYDEKAQQQYNDILKQYNFDYAINSVHVVNGRDCYFKEYFEGLPKQKAYNDYLNAVLQSVYARYDYQIIGHIGYVMRNAPYDDKYLYYSEFKGIIDDILKGIIERQKTLEVNTNIKYDRTATLPDYEIIKRYYDMGGRLITFGSDSHGAERICQNYKPVTEYLKNTGFKEYAYYINKEIFFYKL